MKTNNIKQVIVVRKDLPMRKGKFAVQVAHASLQAFRVATKEQIEAWDENHYKKICVGCKDASELTELYEKAKDQNLPRSFIIDNGLTEFREPTATAIAIGPADAEIIDLITRDLILL